MKLVRSVDIKNFRAFKEVSFNNLGDINIIIGPNNTGKSSFLEAILLALTNDRQFYFLNQSFLKNLSILWNRSLPFSLFFLFYRRNIHYRDFFTKPFIKTLWFERLKKRKLWGFFKEDSATFSELKDKLNKFFFFKESNKAIILLKLKEEENIFTVKRKDINKGIFIENTNEEIIYSDEIIEIGNYIKIKTIILYSLEEPIPLGFLVEKQKEKKEGKENKNFLFVGDFLLKCFSQRIPKGNRMLFESLSKYSEIKTLEILNEKLRNMFNIKRLFPKLEDIYIQTVDGQELPLSLMGDGLYFFILYFYSLHLKNSSILFFEEPENFMHPLMLKIFSQEIIRQSKKHQIFITTHNKDLIDYLVGYASKDVDLKIFNFKHLKNGKLNYKVYSLKEAEKLIYDLEVDLR